MDVENAAACNNEKFSTSGLAVASRLNDAHTGCSYVISNIWGDNEIIWGDLCHAAVGISASVMPCELRKYAESQKARSAIVICSYHLEPNDVCARSQCFTLSFEIRDENENIVTLPPAEFEIMSKSISDAVLIVNGLQKLMANIVPVSELKSNSANRSVMGDEDGYRTKRSRREKTNVQTQNVTAEDIDAMFSHDLGASWK
jgi:hypothetical protein